MPGTTSVENMEELEAQFHGLRRLVASKAGFQAFTALPKLAVTHLKPSVHCFYCPSPPLPPPPTCLPSMREFVGQKVVHALKTKNDAVIHAAIDMLCALMQVRVDTPGGHHGGCPTCHSTATPYPSHPRPHPHSYISLLPITATTLAYHPHPHSHPSPSPITLTHHSHPSPSLLPANAR